MGVEKVKMYNQNAQNWIKHIDFIIIDEVVLQLAFILAFIMRHQKLPYIEPIYHNLAIIFIFTDALIIAMFNTMHNVLNRGYFDELICTIKHCVLALSLVTVYIFAAQSSIDYSRLTLFYTLCLHIILGYFARVIWKLTVKKYKLFLGEKGNMLVILHSETANHMLKQLLDNIKGYQIIGVITDSPCNYTKIEEIPIVSTIEKASDYILKEWIDAVYIDCDFSDPRIKELIVNCNLMAITIHYHVPAIGGEANKCFAERIAETIVLTSSINYATTLQALMKRIFDIFVGIVGSIFALLIIAVIGYKIKKSSPGPILYKQERIGKNGKHFKMIKIRSMYIDAEKDQKELLKQNRVKDGMMFKLDWDPRIIGNEILPDGTKKTGIGDFIRRTSLDEFPQFFNVVMGQMSIVGTRPPTLDEWERYKFHHRARLACKPGITGLWQISGRSEITDFEEVVKLDTKYITDWTFGMDIKIFLKTIFVVLKGKGAR